MSKHVCRESDTCTCCMLATEPNEKCPQHGCGEWPRRCGTCGQFLPWTSGDATTPPQDAARQDGTDGRS